MIHEFMIFGILQYIERMNNDYFSAIRYFEQTQGREIMVICGKCKNSLDLDLMLQSSTMVIVSDCRELT